MNFSGFLTAFFGSVTELVSNLPTNCSIYMQNVTVQGNYSSHCYNAIVVLMQLTGTYALWNAKNEKGSCIQLMSDTIVNALVKYIVPNQPIPDWVLQLPEPLRSEKIGTDLNNRFFDLLMSK